MIKHRWQILVPFSALAITIPPGSTVAPLWRHLAWASNPASLQGVSTSRRRSVPVFGYLTGGQYRGREQTRWPESALSHTGFHPTNTIQHSRTSNSPRTWICMDLHRNRPRTDLLTANDQPNDACLNGPEGRNGSQIRSA